MFEINRFFQPFSSFSKVRGTQSERQVAYDWSIITGPDSGVVRRFPTVQASSNRWQVAVGIISFAREARVDLRSRACEAKPLSGKRGSRAV